MPKQKSNKGVLKRIKFTAKGKAKRHKAGMSHLMAGKSGNTKRKLRRGTLVHKTLLEKYARMAGRK